MGYRNFFANSFMLKVILIDICFQCKCILMRLLLIFVKKNMSMNLFPGGNRNSKKTVICNITFISKYFALK